MGDIPDMMSALPVDILIAIISRLALREATATSILSHRWHYLHNYVTHLKFPTFTSESEWEECSRSNKDLLIKSEKRRFRYHIKMIDGVLDSHRGGGVKELKMHMTRMRGASVMKWLEFAYTKQIEIIDISLQVTPLGLTASMPRGCHYSLELSKFINGAQQIKFLKQLSLEGIDMIDLLFSNSNFVALESVSLGGMRDLKKVSIVGHPKLKHVDIRFTSTARVKSFEIRDVMNLNSLCLGNLSDGCAVELENIPRLTELYYCDNYGICSIVHDDFFAGNGMSSCILDQLQLLHITTTYHMKVCLWTLPFRFVNVKHMELEMKKMSEPTRFNALEALIRACPSLQKLKIKFDWWLYGGVDSIKSGKRKANVYIPHLQKSFPPNLKELEMEGYAGSQSEFELASYIINYAPNLEQITVLPNDATKDIQREATARAKLHFQKLAPSPRLHVKFK